ncbi:amidohydrolase [Lachnospiraceae bacterium NSJ-143]|nr:amidohydrolase [Lachnospiraceae bacterium NSJ-143]
MMKEAKKYRQEILEIRRYLHKNPEVSQKEVMTVKYICEKLKEYGIDFVEVKNGGILGFIGAGCESKTVMLRADIDALPVLESQYNIGGQDKKCVSDIGGVSHVCGHDAHTAMLLAAGKILKVNENLINGRVVLFFERAEEAGGNILYLLRYLHENKIRIDGCMAMHVNGKLETGKISISRGSINAGGFGFEVMIKGRGGHGSAPSLANNPIDCFVELYDSINMIPVKYIGVGETCTFSIGTVNAGTKKNIIPEELIFGGTARFFEHSTGIKFKNEFLRILESMTKTYKCSYEIIKAVGPTLPLVNNDTCVEISKITAADVFGSRNVISMPPEISSESFSAAQRLYPGIYAYIGVKNDSLGTGGELHSPEFDIDEEALCLGAAFEAKFAVDFLNSKREINFDGYNGTPDELYNEICYKVD